MLSQSDIEFLNNEAGNIYNEAISFEVQKVDIPPKRPQVKENKPSTEINSIKYQEYSQDQSPPQSHNEPPSYDIQKRESQQKIQQKNKTKEEIISFEIPRSSSKEQGYNQLAETRQYTHLPESFYQESEKNYQIPPFLEKQLPTDPEALLPISTTPSTPLQNPVEYTPNKQSTPQKPKSPFFSNQKSLTTESDKKHTRVFSASQFQIHETIDSELLRLVIEEPLLTEDDLLFLLKKNLHAEFPVSRRALRKALTRTGLTSSYKRFRAFMTG